MSENRARLDASGQLKADTRAWDHTSLAVTDLDLAIGFYCSVFGYETVFVERSMTDQIESIVGLRGLRCEIAQLRSPISDHVLELIAFHVPAGAEPRGPILPGAAHVAFTVAKLEQAIENASALGAEQLGDITQFEESRSVYMREPSGTVIELSESSISK